MKSRNPNLLTSPFRGGALLSILTRNTLLGMLVLAVGLSNALANSLQGISYSSLSGDSIQVTLEMASPAPEPLIFTIDNPARIALDLTDTTNALTNKSDSIGVGVLNGYSSAEAKGRTRVVLNLSQMTSYETKTSGNNVILTLGGASKSIIDNAVSPVANNTAAGSGSIRNIDFRRGPKGEGLIQVTLPSPKTSVDMRQEGDKLVIDFLSANVPASLQRKLDVKDFATPVYEVSTFNKGKNTRMEIRMDVQNEHLAYQSNEEFIIEVKPLSLAQEEAAKRKGNEYTGEKLSLNFQDIEVRSVLQLLADFTGLNIVVSDTVAGNLTLRLKNVPWDQALDIILRTKGLAQRQTGNVVLIAPAAEIANAERLELEAAQQVRELEPLTAEFIPINYASAEDLAAIISSETSSLLSERGSITVDARTNTLLIRDTASQISEIRELINELDIPVRQVLIESRVVSATDSFSKELGVRFGFAGSGQLTTDGNSPGYQFGGTQGGQDVFNGNNDAGIPINNDNRLVDSATLAGFERDGGNEAYIVDLPTAQTPAGGLALAVGSISSWLLQLEIQALQAEGRGEVISSPRLVTADQTEATIEDGLLIPYTAASSSGATSVEYNEAVLGLTVTPQITPDERIIMDLTVNKDGTAGTNLSGTIIRTQSVTTQVIVDNGETIVLGGVYEKTLTEGLSKVPFFGDLPYVGWAFRNSTKSDNKTELLIFVTPKILKDGSQLN